MKAESTLKYTWSGFNQVSLEELEQILVEARRKQVPGGTKVSMVSGMGYGGWHIAMEYNL